MPRETAGSSDKRNSRHNTRGFSHVNPFYVHFGRVVTGAA